MKQLLLIAFVSMVGNYANAQNVFYNSSAESICRHMTFDSDKSKCMSEIKDAEFDEKVVDICRRPTFDSDKTKCLAVIKNHLYDSSAIGICAAMTFDSDKAKCLVTISDKQFTSQSEINHCRSKVFDSDKIKCLEQASFRDFQDSVNLTIEQIDKAINALQYRNYSRAELILLRLKNQLEASKSRK